MLIGRCWKVRLWREKLLIQHKQANVNFVLITLSYYSCLFSPQPTMQANSHVFNVFKKGAMWLASAYFFFEY